MNIRSEHFDALRNLGYNDQEARFLYLVSIHSGYFTIRQFLDFNDKTKGWTVHDFTTKTLTQRHARSTEYGRRTHVFNLYSRRIYGVIDQDNLRNRRRQSTELVRTRLLILDFVLANPNDRYLETEGEKVAYFHETLGLPLPVLPGRIYKGIRSNKHTKRYFIDRFPIFLPDAKNTLALPPVVTFTYCDTAHPSLASYVAHLRNYQKFLRRLPAFNFVYASSSPSKFPRAAAFFTRLFDDQGRADAHHLVRYFQVRLLWETNRTSMLTRADRDFLWAGDERYHGEPFESAYRKWASRGLSDAEIDTLLGSSRSQQKRSFQTYVLPKDYDLFHRDAGPLYRTSGYNVCSASRSVSRSAPCGS